MGDVTRYPEQIKELRVRFGLSQVRWLIAHRQVERAYRLGRGLLRFWFLRAYLSEGRAWLSELLAQADAQIAAPARAIEHGALKSHTLCLLGEVSCEQGDCGAARWTRSGDCALGVARSRRTEGHVSQGPCVQACLRSGNTGPSTKLSVPLQRAKAVSNPNRTHRTI